MECHTVADAGNKVGIITRTARVFATRCTGGGLVCNWVSLRVLSGLSLDTVCGSWSEYLMLSAIWQSSVLLNLCLQPSQ